MEQTNQQEKKKVTLLDRNNLEFTIERKQLDKLKTKIKDNFKVKYTYELLNQIVNIIEYEYII